MAAVAPPVANLSETVKLSASQFNTKVSDRLAGSRPAEIAEADWELTRLAVREVFSAQSDFLLTTHSLPLIKRSAIEQISFQGRLGGHPQLQAVIAKVMSCYDETFNEVQANTLNEETIREFRPIYDAYIQNAPRTEIAFARDLLKDRLSDKHRGTSLDFRNIVVELPMDQVREVFRKHGVIQIRPIEKEATTLIIACGNGRNCCCGSGPFDYESNQFLATQTAGEYHRKYTLEHNHPRDCVTIDPDPTVNPTIIGFFGHQEMAGLFKGQKFERIIFEGFYDVSNPPFYQSDVRALLAPNGIVCLDSGTGFNHLKFD